MRGRTTFLAVVLLCSACARPPPPSVHEADLDAWVGHPVAELDKHPIFLTLTPVKTVAADGTEIRNYVNSQSASGCISKGATNGTLNSQAYTNFTQCMLTTRACNNIFYIKNGIVERYTPIGTGGASCFADERLRPNFSGSTNM